METAKHAITMSGFGLSNDWTISLNSILSIIIMSAAQLNWLKKGN